MYICFVCRAFMQFMLSQRWSQRKITGAQKYVERLHPLRRQMGQKTYCHDKLPIPKRPMAQ